jgi:hypothetical protein
MTACGTGAVRRPLAVPVVVGTAGRAGSVLPGGRGGFTASDTLRSSGDPEPDAAELRVDTGRDGRTGDVRVDSSRPVGCSPVKRLFTGEQCFSGGYNRCPPCLPAMRPRTRTPWRPSGVWTATSEGTDSDDGTLQIGGPTAGQER